MKPNMSTVAQAAPDAHLVSRRMGGNLYPLATHAPNGAQTGNTLQACPHDYQNGMAKSPHMLAQRCEAVSSALVILPCGTSQLTFCYTLLEYPLGTCRAPYWLGEATQVTWTVTQKATTDQGTVLGLSYPGHKCSPLRAEPTPANASHRPAPRGTLSSSVSCAQWATRVKHSSDTYHGPVSVLRTPSRLHSTSSSKLAKSVRQASHRTCRNSAANPSAHYPEHTRSSTWNE